jgi:Domain of unknown function (DUF5753)/Helix-turn-helix domain
VADSAHGEYGATVAKWRLSRRLIAMRQRTGLSTPQVDAKLHWERGRLQRIQSNRWSLPDISTVRDLLRFYNASDKEQEEAIDLALHARTRLWWREYLGDSKDKNRVFENEFPGFENDAHRITIYLPLVIPGLLQTPAYMQALLQAGMKPPAWRKRAMEARLRRQQILERTDGTAPRLTAVITEASLMYHVGSKADRRNQIDHMASMSQRPNVDLRLIRFEDGPQPGMCGPINIFDFPDDEDPSIVFMETDTSIREVTGSEEARAYIDALARVRSGSLAPAATTVYLERLADTLK